MAKTGVTWSEAQALCQQVDKRLCGAYEWEHACSVQMVLSLFDGRLLHKRRLRFGIGRTAAFWNGGVLSQQLWTLRYVRRRLGVDIQ